MLSAIRFYSLQKRLEDDLQFSKTELQKDFQKFMEKAMELAEAYQKVQGDGARFHSTHNKANTGATGSTRSAPEQVKSSKTSHYSTGKMKGRRPLPPCPFPHCKVKGLHHWIRDCKLLNNEQR